MAALFAFRAFSLITTVMAAANEITPPEPQQQEAGPSGNEERDAKKLRRKQLMKKKVKQLETRLEEYDRQIRRVTEMELTLSDMDSDTSPYLMEDMLKRKFMRTWYQLCNLLHIDPEIRIQQRREEGYSGTRYSEINRRVQRLLSLDEFPDHFDVCQLVERVNEKYSLGIGREERVAISRLVFKEVGVIIQQRRRSEFKHSFGCHLTDDLTDGDDPACSDDTLQLKLERSAVEGEERLAQVCEQFAVRQETEGDTTGTSGEEEEEERGGSGEREEPLVAEQDRVKSGSNSPPTEHVANGEEDDEDMMLPEDDVPAPEMTDTREDDDLIELISSPPSPSGAAAEVDTMEHDCARASDSTTCIVISDSESDD